MPGGQCLCAVDVVAPPTKNALQHGRSLRDQSLVVRFSGHLALGNGGVRGGQQAPDHELPAQPHLADLRHQPLEAARHHREQDFVLDPDSQRVRDLA